MVVHSFLLTRAIFPRQSRGQSCQSEFMRFPHKIFAAPLKEEEMNSNIRTFSEKFILTRGPPTLRELLCVLGRPCKIYEFLRKVNQGKKIRFSKIHFMSILASIH